MAPTELSLAVCLYSLVAPTDFQGPVELFSFLNQRTVDLGLTPANVSTYIKPTYLGATRDPIEATSGPQLIVNRTYDDVLEEGKQFDIVLVPGGLSSSPEIVPKSLIEFVKKQAPGAKYVLSVCTGAEILAAANVLNGRRATTNKSGLLKIEKTYKDKNIEWVRKARWVVDGNIWTSSGVTAGTDMGYAFVKHLVGHDIAEIIRGVVEIGIHEQDDDEFAEFHGLV